MKLNQFLKNTLNEHKLELLTKILHLFINV